jgi:4-hydroxy-4-methyl-2-oxoglutarate aldolase
MQIQLKIRTLSISITLLGICFLSIVSTFPAFPQPIPFKFSNEDYLKFTSLYHGERFADGRPKVSKDILERMKLVTVEEAWGILRDHGYNCQFEQGWVMTHENPVLVGRAATIGFIPHRPDIADVVANEGKNLGFEGRDKHWVMDKLQEDDVIIADLFGRKVGGAFIGDNLANMIYNKTGTGMIVDGGCRDLAGVLELPNFYVFNRNWHPSTSQTYDKTMAISMNAPIRIGEATVIPGDVVLGLREGVMFIPAHLALEVVETSEVIRLKDEFGFIRLKSGTYSAGQIDSSWTNEIRDDFANWVDEKNVKLSEFQEAYINNSN